MVRRTAPTMRKLVPLTRTPPPSAHTHTHVNMHKLLGLGHAEAVVKMLTAHAAGLVARALYNPSPPPLV